MLRDRGGLDRGILMNPTVGALLGFLVYVVVVFLGRSWLQRRRTGDTGFRGVSGPPGSLEWLGGAAFVVALVGFPLGMVLDLTGVPPFWDGEITGFVVPLGIGLATLGAVGCLLAQLGMGAEWRIGVDADERTGLVTVGLFRWMRNPIFSFMVVSGFGLLLIVPNLLTLWSLVLVTVAIELQVRFVEEPYLLRTHPASFRQYAAHTGRFFPGVGRLAADVGDRVDDPASRQPVAEGTD